MKNTMPEEPKDVNTPQDSDKIVGLPKEPAKQNDTKEEIRIAIPKKILTYALIAFLCIGSFIGGYSIGTGGITGGTIIQSQAITSCASYIGLDMEQFNKCFKSGEKEQVLLEDAELAGEYGVAGTPTFVLNCKYKLVGIQDLEDAILALKDGENMTDFFEQKKQETLKTLNDDFALLNQSFYDYVIKEFMKTMPEEEAKQKYDELIAQVMAQENLGKEDAEKLIETQVKDSFEQTKSYIENSYIDVILSREECRGNKILIREFAEFQCPYCYQIEPLVKELLQSYSSIVSYEFHHVIIHGDEAKNQAIASECAREQGKFNEFKDCIFNINNS